MPHLFIGIMLYFLDCHYSLPVIGILPVAVGAGIRTGLGPCDILPKDLAGLAARDCIHRLMIQLLGDPVRSLSSCYTPIPAVSEECPTAPSSSTPPLLIPSPLGTVDCTISSLADLTQVVELETRARSEWAPDR